jgi:uncharacterized protein
VDIAADDLDVTENEEAHRFEVRIGDAVAFLEYTRIGATIAYTHTEVPTSLEGHGVAAKLAEHALDFARANALAVVPLCPYVADYIKRHPDYGDLVAPRARWREFIHR